MPLDATTQAPLDTSPTEGSNPGITSTSEADSTNVSPTIQPTDDATIIHPEPLVTPTYPPTATVSITDTVRNILYESQPGDTITFVAMRFGVLPEDITFTEGSLPDVESLIDPGTLMIIPNRFGNTGPSERLIPDSEFVYSPNTVGFDIDSFVAQQGGYLSRYREFLATGWHTGAQVVAKAARDNSVNPRILLAMLEHIASWVTNPTTPSGDALDYPLGYIDPNYPGLYHQLSILSDEMGVGYYGWRGGTITELSFPEGSKVRIAPDLNAGTVALQYFFSQSMSPIEWLDVLDVDGFISIYRDFFGDPWLYMHPLYEPGLTQPPLTLPFLPGRIWAFTGGPHGAWDREAAWAALDFAPTSTPGGCQVSGDWATAVAPGLIVRTGNGVVVLDLDGDGLEQTGWVITYLHIADDGSIPEGTYVEEGDLIGHPSCEGGRATGSHIHITRKYNGEWILADGSLPFVLSGWEAHAGAQAYQGALTKGDQIVLACYCVTQETLIWR
ncbi:MAG: M23 family metallopeptidase [Anaerolineales bacterium]